MTFAETKWFKLRKEEGGEVPSFVDSWKKTPILCRVTAGSFNLTSGYLNGKLEVPIKDEEVEKCCYLLPIVPQQQWICESRCETSHVRLCSTLLWHKPFSFSSSTFLIFHPTIIVPKVHLFFGLSYTMCTMVGQWWLMGWLHLLWGAECNTCVRTLWCQLEDTFQLIVTPQGMELVMVHIEVISQCFKKYRVEYKACYIFLLDTIQL